MKTIRTLSALALVAGVLMIPAQAQADTVAVAPACEVHYDSGHASVNPSTGEVDFESPSAGATTSGCFTLHADLSAVWDLIPPLPCCIEDWISGDS
ncbi:MAG TPA: hypothetical protein VEV43_10090 [Actinomycetota bacterium]|nr:hypothetical protein [Actinomycetota bacterium]